MMYGQGFRHLTGIVPYQSPWHTASLATLPFDFKVALQYCEFIWLHDPILRPAIQRVISYFMTGIALEDISGKGKFGDNEKESYLDILTRVFNIMDVLKQANESKYEYGNAFVSVLPIYRRFLRCNKCGSSFPIEVVTREKKKFDFKYNAGKVEFSGRCSSCGNTGVFAVDDYVDKAKGELFIKLWSPMNMNIVNDPLTGRSIYRWRIPEDERRRIRQGDTLLISLWPIEMLECVAKDEDFQFADNVIFHMKAYQSCGLRLYGWGVPISLVLQNLCYRNAVAGKSTEQLMLEYNMPTRVITPAGTDQPANADMASDPIQTMDMLDYKLQLSNMLEDQIRDPGAIHALSFPVQYQLLGGEAKQLFPTELLQFTEDTLLNAAMIPVELYRMNMQMQNAPANLRLFESSWQDLVLDTNRLLDWISEKLRLYLSWEAFRAKLIVPRVIDDVQNQNARVQLMAAGSISQTTGMEAVGLNFKTEQRNLADEERYRSDLQQKVQKEQEVQAAGAQLGMPPQQPPPGAGGGMPAGPPPGGGAGMPPGGGGGNPSPMGMGGTGSQPIAPDQMMAQAKEIATQLLNGMSEQDRHLPLNQLREQNPAMHALVVNEMDKMRASAGSQNPQPR